MNNIALTGTVYGKTKKPEFKRGTNHFGILLDAPYSHQIKKYDENYCARLRIELLGDDADWAYETLDEGSHFEMVRGFLNNWWYKAQNRSCYKIVATAVNKTRSGDVPEDYKPVNLGRFSGRFVSQWNSDPLPDGTPHIAICVAATPDIEREETKIENMVSVNIYGELAEKYNGRLVVSQFLYVEGPLQSFSTGRKQYGVICNAVDVH